MRKQLKQAITLWGNGRIKVQQIPFTCKKHIMTNVWSVQHPNAGRNIQQLGNERG